MKIPVCATCLHFVKGRSCAAFDKIPDIIWETEHDHATPVDGDGGVLYAPESGATKSYPSPHYGRPGQRGGSLPRSAGAASQEMGQLTLGLDIPAPWQGEEVTHSDDTTDYSNSEAFTDGVSNSNYGESWLLNGGVVETEIVEIEGDGRGVMKQIRSYPKRREGETAVGLDHRVYHANFHDGHSEVLAYQVSEMLGLDIVPETVLGEGAYSDMTFQRFVDDPRTGFEFLEVYRDWENEDDTERVEGWVFENDHYDEINNMRILDVIMADKDRHAGNILISGKDERLWSIDYGHSKGTHIENRGGIIFLQDGGYAVRVDAFHDSFAMGAHDIVEITQAQRLAWSKITEDDFYDTIDAAGGWNGKINYSETWANFDLVRGAMYIVSGQSKLRSRQAIEDYQ